MKSKQISFIFIIIALVLGGLFYFSRKVVANRKTEINRAKVVTPKYSREKETESSSMSTLQDSEVFETMVPLSSTETLISSISIDFNNDTNDDEVIVIRKAGSQYLWIVPGIFNKEKNDYDRMDAIPTKILSTKTFSYSTMDIIGDHSVALVYQGVEEDGNYVMKIFLCKTGKFGNNELVTIGDFSSDGTVFIQQTERPESYELAMTKGESYSVWVYKSELPEDSKTKSAIGLNQIQEEYKWNSISQKYELAQTINVAASRLAAKELSRIQDGTVETFASFLNGLWYKTDNADSEIRYLYFDYNSREIIQLYNDTQEVYEWDDSKLRHNGIYITAANADIVNLHRRFDIALSNVDEIKLTIRDEVLLKIAEKTLWDGVYKKMSIQSSFEDSSTPDVLAAVLNELRKDKIWNCSELQMNLKFDNHTYSLVSQNPEEDGAYSEKGIFAATKNGNYIVLQFRSDDGASFFYQNYAVSFGTKVITETVKRKTVEKTVVDHDVVIFTPVKATPTDCYLIEGRAYTFTRGD